MGSAGGYNYPYTPSAHEKWRVLHPQIMGYNP